MNESAFSGYRNLINEIDNQVSRLERMHAVELNCAPGCCSCCVNLSVFRVEFDSIVDQIEQAGVQPDFDDSLSCGFLKSGLCFIYQFRPLICRTHGLPVAYLTDIKEWQIDFCPENFRSAGSHIFNSSNCLNLEQLNLRLYLINQQYCEKMGYDSEERIALHHLINPKGVL